MRNAYTNWKKVPLYPVRDERPKANVPKIHLQKTKANRPATKTTRWRALGP
jgi:hypothetical protein